jgi:hypothetical protein
MRVSCGPSAPATSTRNRSPDVICALTARAGCASIRECFFDEMNGHPEKAWDEFMKSDKFDWRLQIVFAAWRGREALPWR